MVINFGIVALVDGSIAHFCGYENKPSTYDIESLRKELQTNSQFGLVGVDFKLAHATKEIIDCHKPILDCEHS
jgi:hypothetical protein